MRDQPRGGHVFNMDGAGGQRGGGNACEWWARGCGCGRLARARVRRAAPPTTRRTPLPIAPPPHPSRRQRQRDAAVRCLWRHQALARAAGQELGGGAEAAGRQERGRAQPVAGHGAPPRARAGRVERPWAGAAILGAHGLGAPQRTRAARTQWRPPPAHAGAPRSPALFSLQTWKKVTTELLMSGADTKVSKFFINCLAEEPSDVSRGLHRSVGGGGPAARPAARAALPVAGARPQRCARRAPSPSNPHPHTGGAVPRAARAARAAGERDAVGRHQQHGAATGGWGRGARCGGGGGGGRVRRPRGGGGAGPGARAPPAPPPGPPGG
jgi:hypothetical protein